MIFLLENRIEGAFWKLAAVDANNPTKGKLINKANVWLSTDDWIVPNKDKTEPGVIQNTMNNTFVEINYKTIIDSVHPVTLKDRNDTLQSQNWTREESPDGEHFFLYNDQPCDKPCTPMRHYLIAEGNVLMGLQNTLNHGKYTTQIKLLSPPIT